MEPEPRWESAQIATNRTRSTSSGYQSLAVPNTSLQMNFCVIQIPQSQIPPSDIIDIEEYGDVPMGPFQIPNLQNVQNIYMSISF